jgi:membrane-bound lytic murein transglycosylase D
MFGDWQLAIGGYNMNPYRLMRIVERTSERLGRQATFWDVWDMIPRETRGYVPSFIAVSLLFSNPDAFDVIPVRGGTTLASIADRAGTDLRTLQALNPALQQNRVPDWADGFEVRLPAGHFGRYQRQLAAHMVRTEGIVPRTVAYHGQNRRVIAFAQPHVPGERMGGPSAAAIPVQQVADGIRNGRSSAPDAAPAATTRTATPQTQRIVYRVQRGDTLIRIAQRHGVTVAQLRQWNNIRGSTIRIGQRLTIHRPASRRS